MRLASWGATDIGQARSNNEDAFLMETELGLFAVADGMGGFQKGDVASQVAVNVLKEHVFAQRSVVELYRRAPSHGTRGAVEAMLEDAFQHACEEVHQASLTAASTEGRMGTTLDALLIVGRTAFVAHVGDGRVYLLRSREIHQVTEDHSLVAERIRAGELDPADARRAKDKNVITRAVGVFPSVQVDTLHFDLDPGDTLLLCSDGLYRYLGLRELGFTLMNGVDRYTASSLVHTANERGGRDNITALVLSVEPESLPEAVPDVATMSLLRRCVLFQYCTARELRLVAAIVQHRDVPEGSLLFTEGDVGRECFVVARGAVQLERAGEVLATLRPATFFGEMSFLDAPQRSASARAASPVSVLVIGRDDFLQLMKQDADLAVKLSWQLLKRLARIVRQTNARLVAEAVSLDSLLPLDDDVDA